LNAQATQTRHLPPFRRIGAPLVLLFVSLTISPVRADPLKSFEEIVSRCRQSVSVPATEIRNLTNIGKWAKIALQPEGQLEYDVRKTDSLVSPYVATITFVVMTSSEQASTETEAQQLQLSFDIGRVSREKTTLRFAYQAGEWVAQDGTQTYEFRRSSTEPFRSPSTVKLPKEDYLKPFRQSERCLRR